MTDKEKTKQGLDAFKDFFDSLGPDDIYKQILIEELFKKLCDPGFADKDYEWLREEES